MKGERTLFSKNEIFLSFFIGNIPVSNGVVHLIDKPLMIVARSLYEYVSEEGRLPGNRLSKVTFMCPCAELT